MRKPLIVLVLTMTSLVLFQAPAWAPHLYKLTRTDRDLGRNATWTAEIDCAPGQTAHIPSGRFERAVDTPVLAPLASGGHEGRVVFYSRMRLRYASVETFSSEVTCSLPSTGDGMWWLAAVAVGLLLLGGALVALGQGTSSLTPGWRRLGPPPGP